MLYLFILLISSFGFILVLDPYGLYRKNTEKKRLPYYTWYHYNFIKKVKEIDLGLLGSSAINYYSKEPFLKEANTVFFMGVESSNIHEHLAYGRLLFKKNPKKIIFFYTFYAMNPSRAFQPEFKANMVKNNNLLTDIYYQYLTPRLLKDLYHGFLIKLKRKPAKPQLFLSDGRRTQLHYLNRKDYEFDEVLADYLAAMSIDPHYYNSERFKQPDSIVPAFELVREFKEEAERMGIEMVFVATPVYRSTLALKYRLGLWDTYTRYRQEMLRIGEFYDLNLDFDLVTNKDNWWDTHHTRHGDYVSELIINKAYLVNQTNLESTTEQLKPVQKELDQVDALLTQYKRWDSMKERVNKRVQQTPPLG
ncbi:hypothetical protein DIZ81_09705 [Legionella taurinensis]|uniref:Uncharacterized protein n=1 Tax=Legionella taurinensis TaxID=70611 RepID=A0A3A5L4W3_9GAMM|nr:hypothetical protein [Legionella taurinensis]MDX1838003.1 hypothetical protein [Legionella taurinensis]PUT39409.1 hypothetical protein DB744_09715 [Legionella taurinensis]PUT41718.1 hypothetical protein DB746_08630 [Legionella taurinensis]PUT44552.1 hypothetical protein DB743_07845 [Legionella taurinensis]PUT46796.1 hypothetical protein DB745_09710 [Legionella taurinensis]